MQNPNSATKTVCTQGAACGYGWSALFFILFFTSSIIVVSMAPICQSPPVTITFAYWNPPVWCELGIRLGITNVSFAVIWAPLTLAGISMLANKTPAEASNNQFSCLFIWVLILASTGLFTAFWEAMGITLSSSTGTYSCYFFFSFSTGLCGTQFQTWLLDAEVRSRPHRAYATAVAWIWLLFNTVAIIVPSRTKYWCCPDCKQSCPQSGSEDDCGTCVCCLGEVPQQQSGAVAVGGTAVAMTGQQPVALAVGQMQPMGQPMGQPMQQMTEVQYWLTYEIGLPAYAPIFIQQGYTHMQSLLFNINTEQDLRRIVPSIDPTHVAPMLNNLNAKRQAAQGYVNAAAAPAGGYPAPQGYGAQPVGYEGGMTQQQT